jgi:hypothetical protein
LSDLIDRVFALGGLLVPIVAIIVGGAIAITGMVHRHQERLAKIERGWILMRNGRSSRASRSD